MPTVYLKIHDNGLGPTLYLRATVLDARNLGKTIQVHANYGLGPFQSEEQAVMVIKYNLLSWWHHEFDEWLRLDGNLVKDPHHD